MKKYYLHLFFILLLCMNGKSVSAHDIEVPNADGVVIYYNYINDGTELTVTFRGHLALEYRNEYSGAVAIPEEVVYEGRTLRVTCIGWSAFDGCSELTSVVIPNSVTELQHGSFYDCSGLTSITIPNSVKSIGEEAFDGCYNLISVHVSDIETWCRIQFGNPDGNPLYQAHHLYVNGEEIKDLVIPNSVTTIGNYAFAGCSLTSADISNGVTSIGEGAFYGCTVLTTVNMANSVKTIGPKAFESCCGLIAVVIPNSLTIIDERTFYGCKGLTTVDLANGVTIIENYAFSGCTSLTSVIIPNGVTKIGGYSFGGCFALSSVTLGNSVTTIGVGAFDGCMNLTSIDIPSSMTTIGRNAFQNCGLISINIPNSVTTIGYSAFSCCNLTSIVIPNSVTSIGYNAFEYCKNLTNVYCYAEQVPNAKSAFSYSNYTNATLHIPAASIEDYKNAEQWKDFGNIVALTDDDPKPTGIEVSTAKQLPTIIERYTIDGKRITTPQRGLNIVKMSDGTTKKIIVK